MFYTLLCVVVVTFFLRGVVETFVDDNLLIKFVFIIRIRIRIYLCVHASVRFIVSYNSTKMIKANKFI